MDNLVYGCSVWCAVQPAAAASKPATESTATTATAFTVAASAAQPACAGALWLVYRDDGHLDRDVLDQPA
jgi:hypothetical protein